MNNNNSTFDQSINRISTGSEKWDALEDIFGAADALPMWVADMDFGCSTIRHSGPANTDGARDFWLYSAD